MIILLSLALFEQNVSQEKSRWQGFFSLCPNSLQFINFSAVDHRITKPLIIHLTRAPEQKLGARSHYSKAEQLQVFLPSLSYFPGEASSKANI